jgi:mRNA interferase MazF
MPYKRGEIVLCLFPDSTQRTAKRRPALVVQADNLGTGLPQVIVAMITTNLARAGHPKGQQTGLHADSVIATDNLATMHDSEIDRAIGICPDIAAVDAALRQTLGL